ncbi:MAG TPA: TolC family protein [Kiritimatiellia bacterium]|nr:TolC family protein [Kiritimatiellia bacterium]HMO98468.1 TolC family protein [Kiritimatiellia bacterium]HMP96520.1 TolC family protein [Kiritimatiellia bacterium]
MKRLWILGLAVVALLTGAPAPVFADSLPVLTLAECIQRGLEGSRLLHLQRLQLASASAEVMRAAAPYDPRLQFDGFYQDSELPPGSFPTSGGVERGQATARLLRGFASGTQLGVELDAQRNYFQGIGGSGDPIWRTAAGLTLRQELGRNAFGAGERARTAYIRGRLESLSLQYEQARNEVAARIADRYWQAVTARQDATVQEAVSLRLERLLAVNQKRVEEGLLDASAVLAVEAALAVAGVQAEVARYRFQSLDDQVKELADLPVRDWDRYAIEYRLPPPDGIGAPIDFLDAYEHALRYRADLDAWRREERRVEDLIRWRQADDRPEVSLSGGIGRGDSGAEWDETLDFDKTVWSIGLFADLSLKRSETRAAVAEAMIERERIREDVEQLERVIALECRAAVREQATARRLLMATRRALDAQTQKLAMETDRFDRGQSDIKTVLDYEADREAAEREWMAAQGAYQRARVALGLAQGMSVLEMAP